MKDLMKYLKTSSKNTITLIDKHLDNVNEEVVELEQSQKTKHFVDIPEVSIYDNAKNYKGYALHCDIGKIGIILGVYKCFKRTNNIAKNGWNYKDCVDIYFKPSSIGNVSMTSNVMLTQIPLFVLDFSSKRIVVKRCKGYIKEKRYKYIDWKTRSIKESYDTVNLIFDKHEEGLIAKNQSLSHQIDIYRNLFYDTANVVKNYEKIRKGEKE